MIFNRIKARNINILKDKNFATFMIIHMYEYISILAKSVYEDVIFLNFFFFCYQNGIFDDSYSISFVVFCHFLLQISFNNFISNFIFSFCI